MDIISENGLSKGRKPRPHGWSRRGKGWGREGWREDWREERGEPCRDFLGHRGFKLLNQFIAVFEWEEGFVWIRTSGRYIRVFLHHHTGLWRKRSYHSVTSDWPLKRPVRLGVLVWPGCNCETFGGVVHSPIYIYIYIYIHICKPLADESMTGNPFLNSSWWTPGSNQNWVTGYFHSHVV